LTATIVLDAIELRACLKRVLRSAWLHDSPRKLQLMW
jgi:hypothetical protein